MSEFKDTIKGKPIHSLVIISVFAITVFLRFFYISNDYFHPDEVITTRVVEYMEQTGDYDTNWRKADLPPSFKYDQYNFSSYISSVYLFSRLIGSSNMFTYRVFSVICSSTIFIILLLLAHKTKEKLVYLYTAFLTAIAPILVQDAHYARPEAFVSLLTLCVIYLCWPRKEPRLYSSYMAAILIGFLVACKISMAFFVWLPFIPAYDGLKRKKCIPVSRMFLFVVTVVILTILGFFIGVPRALKNPEAYIHGVQELLHQYDGLHPGHSHLAGGSVADLLFGYLGTTLGWAMMVFFVVGCLSKLGERAWDIIVLIL
jgi:4-amino-4-deoxy-L-arabinose transferase-like glycosyltransferase